MDLEPPSFRYGRFCSVLLDWSIRFDSIQFGWCGQLGLVVLPTTLMLWVSLTPWRKGFPVIAGLPLSSPPPGETPGYFYCRIFLFGVGALEILFVGWTPRLCLSNSTSRFTTRFLLHNDRFVGWTPGPLFFGWTPRRCLSNSKLRSLARLLLHKDFWLDPWDIFGGCAPRLCLSQGPK